MIFGIDSNRTAVLYCLRAGKRGALTRSSDEDGSPSRVGSWVPGACYMFCVQPPQPFAVRSVQQVGIRLVRPDLHPVAQRVTVVAVHHPREHPGEAVLGEAERA